MSFLVFCLRWCCLQLPSHFLTTAGFLVKTMHGRVSISALHQVLNCLDCQKEHCIADSTNCLDPSLQTASGLSSTHCVAEPLALQRHVSARRLGGRVDCSILQEGKQTHTGSMICPAEQSWGFQVSLFLRCQACFKSCSSFLVGSLLVPWSVRG